MDNTSDPHYLQVNIKASKTDPFHQGVFVYLGRTNVDVCPVAAVLAYMVIRGPAPDPFFRFEDGKYLTRGCFVAAVRAALKQSSIDDSKFVMSTRAASHSKSIPDKIDTTNLILETPFLCRTNFHLKCRFFKLYMRYIQAWGTGFSLYICIYRTCG